MELSNQIQKAGDNSTQMQAGVINNYTVVNNGIDETRAMEICHQQFQLLARDLIEEAKEIAKERVEQFSKKMIPKLAMYDEQLKAFAEPSFIKTLRSAQMSAACSNRETDYDMLADLLLHRVEQGEDRERRLGISKAIEIVDQISDEALRGIALFYALTKFSPVSNNLQEGLEILDNLYNSILEGHELPNGDAWLEHLDILDVIRLGTKGINSFKKMKKYAPHLFPSYFVSGIKEDADEFQKIKEEFTNCQLPLNIFVPHQLKQNYVKLGIDSDIDIDKMYINQENSEGISIRVPLTEEQKTAMKHAVDVLCKKEMESPEMQTKLMEEWDKFSTLNKVRQWWDSLPCHFSITPIGVALSNAYIQGKDPTIPCMY